MLNPEDSLNAGLDRKRRQEEHTRKYEALRARIEMLLPKAHEYAKAREQAAVSMNDAFFRSISKEKRDADRRYLSDWKRSVAANVTIKEPIELEALQENRVLASAFEYVVTKRINDSGWLGDMRAQLTSEIDDIRNGIDLYVERNGKPVGVSFDLTFAKTLEPVVKKLLKIRGSLDTNRLAQLEYYVPLDPAKREEMVESDGYPLTLPKVIIGVAHEDMLTVIERYAKGEKAKPDAPNGLIMLYQTRLQLGHYAKYCRKFSGGMHASATAAAHQRALEEIEEVWKLKLAGPPPLDESKVVAFALNDPFTKNLREQLNQLMPMGDTKY